MARLESKRGRVIQGERTNKQVPNSGPFVRKKEHVVASIKLYSQAMPKTSSNKSTVLIKYMDAR